MTMVRWNGALLLCFVYSVAALSNNGPQDLRRRGSFFKRVIASEVLDAGKEQPKVRSFDLRGTPGAFDKGLTKVKRSDGGPETILKTYVPFVNVYTDRIKRYFSTQVSFKAKFHYPFT